MTYIKKHPKTTMLLFVIIAIILWDLSHTASLRQCKFSSIDSRNFISAPITQKTQKIYDLNHYNLWQKIKTGQKIEFYNTLNTTAEIHTDNQSIKKELSPKEKISFVVPAPKGQRIVASSNKHPLYLNPSYSSSMDKITFSIEEKPNLYAPLFDSDYNFHDIRKSYIKFRIKRHRGRWFNPELFAESEAQKAQKFHEKYTLIPFNYLNITKKQVDNHRHKLYQKNKFSQLLKQTPDYWNTPYKIPPVFHKVWVTHKHKPSKIPTKYLDWYKQNYNASSSDWSFMLWIQDFDHQPGLKEEIEQNYPFITIRFLSELNEFKNKDHFNKIILEGNFGKASDILRYEILNKEGGVYMDTDFRIFEDLSPYNHLYDFYISQESVARRTSNGFIGTSAGHPVIKAAVDLVYTSLNPATQPDYVSDKIADHTFVTTGPDMLCVVFYQQADQPGYTDIILPPGLFIPKQPALYPDPTNDQIDSFLSPALLGYHSYDSAWFDPNGHNKTDILAQTP